jgi:hypothetical protein
MHAVGWIHIGKGPATRGWLVLHGSQLKAVGYHLASAHYT